ncbi:hypothetical protein PPL_11232 [Heterostelium album PN500]|uniref:Uncharacterized protein n=1 Tax=Heterostelium pallidum (strain ATCC 26659 / Pp 5 / PN500) TaxID=670386 RepID=D3BTX2_HETP5|nr:hypothetical protein PPL_11232 [Heterostelium album PN500]EFA75158.1 hypothetical protein PPL_11232 [Heterostelium album PN500]|eukprot:XP_020427292.1 hypothetical protein PPL_11232 [Heterostelium album PN500]
MIDIEISQAITHIWNNKFDQAELLLMPKVSTNPRYCLHYAESAFLRSFITASLDDTELALRRLKDTKDLAESYIKLLESNKCPPGYKDLKSKEEFKNHLLDCKVVLGDSLYMLAVLQITRDSKFKGCFNMRKSWKVFEEALKQVKDGLKYDDQLLECLHFGAGFFFFAMSIIPQKFLKIVEFVGFKADRELGLQYIRECSSFNSTGIRSPFATMVLLFNNLLLPRGLYNPAKQLREAEILLEENVQRYPEGSLFHVMMSHCHRKQCRIDKGLECMEQAIANCSNFQRPPAIYSYELANCYYLAKLEKKYAEMALDTLVKIAASRNVLTPVKLASSNGSGGQSQSSSFLSRTFSFGSSKKQQQQQQSTIDEVATPETINDRAAYLMLRGAILKGIDRVEESMVCFEEVIGLQAHLTEKFYYPYCLYEMSESHFHLKNHELSLDYLKRCNTVTGYDWEDPLKVRLRVTMDQIKKDGAGSDWGEEAEEVESTTDHHHHHQQQSPAIPNSTITQLDTLSIN